MSDEAKKELIRRGVLANEPPDEPVEPEDEGDDDDDDHEVEYYAAPMVCRLWHKWTLWRREDVTVVGGSAGPIKETRDKRHCLRCHKIQFTSVFV